MVIRSPFSAVRLALVGTVILFTLPGAAMSQNPEPSQNPGIYKAHLRQAVALTKKNLRDIQALSTEDSNPLSPELIENCRMAYAFIRAARHGMDLARQKQLQKQPSYQDPVFELAFKRVEDAWNLARMPVDGRDMKRGDYISQATSNLTSAIRLIDQALIILP